MVAEDHRHYNFRLATYWSVEEEADLLPEVREEAMRMVIMVDRQMVETVAGPPAPYRLIPLL
jgi:hypothetical protein